MEMNSTPPSSADTGYTAPKEPPCSLRDGQPDECGTESSPKCVSGMTLEQIIDLTGEFTHLHELVMIHIERSGGFAGPDAYFKTVQPLLDRLEVEIQIRFRPGMTPQQVKLIVQDWIDQKMRECGN